METILREQYIDRLNNSWQPYIERYQRLSVKGKIDFLQKQGYETFAALLAHIIAWWQDGAQVIQAMRQDATLPLPDYDVDEFNARAVRNAGALTEAEVLQAYEAQRKAMLELVTQLSDRELYQENINTRLYYEILMHWTEHSLENSD